MHEENRFFRTLWRINAILLALAGLLAVGLLCVVAASLLYSGLGRRGDTVPVQGTAVDKIHFELDPEGAALQGTPFVAYALHKVRGSESEQGAQSGSFSGRYNPMQEANDLIVDGSAARGTWLFAHETQAVWSREFLYKNPNVNGGDVVTGLILTVADSDSDGDGALTGSDRPSLYYYRPGDSRAIKFFSADEFWNVRQIDGATFSVIFTAGGKKSVAVFSTADFKSLRQGVLPDVPN